MTIIATCGHYITSEEMDKGYIEIKEYSSGERCIASLVVCPRCLWKYADVLIKNKEDKERWLNG